MACVDVPIAKMLVDQGVFLSGASEVLGLDVLERSLGKKKRRPAVVAPFLEGVQVKRGWLSNVFCHPGNVCLVST